MRPRSIRGRRSCVDRGTVPAPEQRAGPHEGAGRPDREPGKHTQAGTTDQNERPRRMTGSFLVEPRGARSAFAGWDLGRNDHTDEVGRGRPAEPVTEDYA